MRRKARGLLAASSHSMRKPHNDPPAPASRKLKRRKRRAPNPGARHSCRLGARPSHASQFSACVRPVKLYCILQHEYNTTIRRDHGRPGDGDRSPLACPFRRPAENRVALAFQFVFHCRAAALRWRKLSAVQPIIASGASRLSRRSMLRRRIPASRAELKNQNSRLGTAGSIPRHSRLGLQICQKEKSHLKN